MDLELKRVYKMRKVYAHISNIFKILTAILICVSTVVSFVFCGNIIAGVVSTTALSINGLSVFFETLAHKKTDYINAVNNSNNSNSNNNNIPYPTISA